jgi:hypothetical protein
MGQRQYDGTLQTAAGITLLRNSKLVAWDDCTARFSPETEDVFETSAAQGDRLFGRLMKWMQFSAGYEFLLKGVLIFKISGETNIVGTKHILVVPGSRSEIGSHEWWRAVRRHTAAKEWKRSFGTLGTLGGHLETFLQQKERSGSSTEECDQVFAATELLRDAIRNRDAHAYVANVRKQQHELVHLFVPALNTLLDWVGDDALLRGHRAKAAELIGAACDDPFTAANVAAELNSAPTAT